MGWVLRIRGWRLVGLGWRWGGFRDQGVEIGRFRGGDGVGLRIRGWRLVGLDICKVGGVGSG